MWRHKQTTPLTVFCETHCSMFFIQICINETFLIIAWYRGCKWCNDKNNYLIKKCLAHLLLMFLISTYYKTIIMQKKLVLFDYNKIFNRLQKITKLTSRKQTIVCFKNGSPSHTNFKQKKSIMLTDALITPVRSLNPAHDKRKQIHTAP